MKRKIYYFIIIVTFILVFKNYNVILTSTLLGFKLFLTKVFPFLFIMIILNDLLLSLNIIGLFQNKYNFIFLSSLFSGTPTNAFVINDLYKNKIINRDFANYSLLTTYFCNPLFLFTILRAIFTKKITIKLLLIHYLTKLIISLIYKKHLNIKSLSIIQPKLNITKSIKKALDVNLMVLGTIIFYLIITNIFLNVFSLPVILNTLFKGLIEITQGLNNLININLSLKIKEILALLFISFGGISIHTQVKSIISETDLEYKYFLKGRILEVIISFIMIFCCQC